MQCRTKDMQRYDVITYKMRPVIFYRSALLYSEKDSSLGVIVGLPKEAD